MGKYTSMRSREMSVKWYCKRCAEALNVKLEPEPMVLRLCSNCKVENYCWPCGHAGEDVTPIEEEPEPTEVAEAVEAPEVEAKANAEKIAELEAELKALKGD